MHLVNNVSGSIHRSDCRGQDSVYHHAAVRTEGKTLMRPSGLMQGLKKLWSVVHILVDIQHLVETKVCSIVLLEALQDAVVELLRVVVAG